MFGVLRFRIKLAVRHLSVFQRQFLKKHILDQVETCCLNGNDIIVYSEMPNLYKWKTHKHFLDRGKNVFIKMTKNIKISCRPHFVT